MCLRSSQRQQKALEQEYGAEMISANHFGSQKSPLSPKTDDVQGDGKKVSVCP